MSLPGQEFVRWMQDRGMPTSVAAFSRLAGLSRTTVQHQLAAGRVPEETLVAACRAVALDPLSELSTYEQYEGLDADTLPPTAEEALSQTTYVDLAQEIAWRTGRTPDRASLSPMPHALAVREWVQAVDRGRVRGELSARSGIAAPNLSTQITSGRLSPALAVEVARIAGVAPRNGLVVTGLITPQEAAWSANVREDAVSALNDDLLLELTASKLQLARKAMRGRSDSGIKHESYLSGLT